MKLTLEERTELGALTRKGEVQVRVYQRARIHLLVDTLGLLLRVKVYEANVRERKGVEQLLAPITLIFSRLERVWADIAYRGQAKA